MKNLQISGLVNGLDLDALMKNQAYSDRDLVFTEPQTFAAGFNVSAMEVEGLFQGVNVSEMCDNVLNPVDVNEMRNDFYNLINKTKTLIDFVKGW